VAGTTGNMDLAQAKWPDRGRLISGGHSEFRVTFYELSDPLAPGVLRFQTPRQFLYVSTATMEVAANTDGGTCVEHNIAFATMRRHGENRIIDM